MNKSSLTSYNLRVYAPPTTTHQIDTYIRPN